MTVQVSINVRFLLWIRRIARADWQKWLSERTQLPVSICRRLINGSMRDSEISRELMDLLAESLSFEGEVERLRSTNLAGSVPNTLLENLRFLFGALERGGKKTMAAELGVDPTTVSRWLAGTSEPQMPSLRQLVSYFGLAPETDLETDPIFLSATPFFPIEQRNWLHKRIDALSLEELRELFPALMRMLEER